MSMVARVRGLTVTAPDGSRILDAVGLELTSGRVTGLVGPSGSGKTTLALGLLGHLGRGLRREAGSVEVDGVDPFSPAGRRRLRGRTTGYVPQDPASALDPRRRLGAQLRTAARIAWPQDDRAARAARIEQAARDAALDPPLLHRYPGQLSGGQAQRGVLTWTLVTRPALILLDEPTSGLDPDTALRVSQRFTGLPWRPAVLLISHDLALVNRIADETLVMDRGRLSPARRHAPAPAPARAAASTSVTATPPPGNGTVRAALAFEGVTVRHGALRVLDDAGARVDVGEILAIRGTSGSGKTSLARALCGLAPPAAGRLLVDGTPVSWDAADRARTGQPYLAYVGQDARAALNPHETVRRTLTRALAANPRRGRPAGWTLEEIVERFALAAEVLDRTPDRLSGGQRHRVALARAVAAAPAVLVCDESTASLDRDTEAHVLDTIDHLRRRDGTPVVLVTHSGHLAARADRVLTLADGQLR
ncbi:ATP-binding cassette domain-containing protein [Micromonospora sp. WMMD980]|uniref:ABC transporter ATP-binding protein n=1 Tax=Micromonospora sp. WMMD980 TaxID=3016088 RepID=UPI00241746E3|nr:ATP-binding cassette domain-containing protein [Micromonospora sp. WMMD980]MDG4799965.1 ATP-binding cassette domain-containing protein [Micromonospora sp. WMMD980]